MGTNCLGPFLLTVLLEDILKRTATSEAEIGKKNTVRIVWTSSIIHASQVPKGGVIFDEAGNPAQRKAMENYMQTKCGDVHLGVEFAKKLGKDGILSVVSYSITIS